MIGSDKVQKTNVKIKSRDNYTLGERIAKDWKKHKYLYIMSAPILIYFILFKYLPMFGLAIAFKDYSIVKGVFGSEWVGLKYFKEFFSSIYFGRTMLNTLIISAMDIVIGFPIPIIFALLLDSVRNKGLKKITQTASYLPHFISTVVFCGIIKDFFSTDGLISVLISNLGGENISYIAEKSAFREIFVGTGIWQSFGWNSIIYLAALSGIDASLYEAAEIDGASKWKQLLHVTIPGIANTIIIMLILRLGQVLSIGYEKIILLYSPQTYEVADVISSYTYRVGIMDGRYGYSAAVGMFQSVVNVIILFAANKISSKYQGVSLF